MGLFGGIYLTNQGAALQAKAQAGVTLQFTKIEIGDGSLTAGQQISSLTALISSKKSMEITKLETLTGGKAVVGTSFTNADVTTAFYMREIGVFAQDPDVGEILYSYGNAGATADLIPAGTGNDILERFINAVTIVGNASNVTASIDESLIYATAAELDDLSVQVPKFGTTTNSGNAYSISFSPASSSLNDGFPISIKINANNTGAATLNVNGLGDKPLKKANGNDFATGQLKAGSIYSFRFNATTGNFIAQGEGGEYGTAGAAQTLIGYSIGTDNGLVNGSMPENGALNYMPGKTAQTIPAGHTTGGTVAAVTVDASKLLTGTTVAGTAGTMPNNGTLIFTPSDAQQTIPVGYTSGGTVAAVPPISGQTVETVTLGETININEPVYLAMDNQATALATPSVVLQGTPTDCAITRDGTLSCFVTSYPPYMHVYSRSGDIWTKIADPAILPGGIGITCCFSPDKKYLAVGSASTSLQIYKISGTTLTKIASPTTLPSAGSVTAMKFTSDNKYLLVCTAMPAANSIFFIYRVDADDVFTYMAKSGPTNSIGSTVAFALSPDNTRVAISIAATTTVAIYSLTNGTLSSSPVASFTKSYSTLGTKMTYSPDGKFLLGASNNSGGVIEGATVNGDVYTPFIPTLNGNGYTSYSNSPIQLIWSKDGNLVISGTTTGTFVFQWIPDLKMLVYRPSDPSGNYTNYNSSTADISDDNVYLICGYSPSPYFKFYKLTTRAWKSKGFADWRMAHRTGVAKEAGTAGQSKQIKITHR